MFRDDRPSIRSHSVETRLIASLRPYQKQLLLLIPPIGRDHTGKFKHDKGFLFRYPLAVATLTSSPLHLLVGTEDFLRTRHLQAQLKRFVDPATKDFNFDRVSAEETSIDHILDLFNTQPMMAERRVVVVDDADVFDKAAQEKLVAYFKNSNPQTSVFFIADKLDKRTSFYQTLSAKAEVIEFKPVYENQVARFVLDEARRMKLSLDESAAQTLASLMGRDLSAVVSELEKLSLYVHPNTRITEKNVVDLVSAGLVDNIFAITNLLGLKKHAAAHALFTRMREQGEPLIKIITLIINHFRKLLLAHTHLVERASQQDLMKVLGVPQFFLKDYTEQVRQFSLLELQTIFKKLMKLSEQVRESGVSPDLCFENFLKEVCL